MIIMSLDIQTLNLLASVDSLLNSDNSCLLCQLMKKFQSKQLPQKNPDQLEDFDWQCESEKFMC